MYFVPNSDIKNDLRVLTVYMLWCATMCLPIDTVVDCGRLDAPENGIVQFQTTTFTSIAFYQCNEGFILNGAETRRCQANGQWSGAAPTCRGQLPLNAGDHSISTTEAWPFH